jgi:ATP-binding cassette subfamily B multidrug efflux pump
VLLATFLAQLIDLTKSAAIAASFFSDHAGLLVWMAFVVLIARPTIIFVYELLKNQVLSPPFQTRVRWQTHGYMLRQSLDFFQNEFSGRVANKLMQTAPAIRDSFIMLSDTAVFVAVRWLSAIVLFWAADPRLIIPLIVWLAAYGFALAWFVPVIRERSTEASEARSTRSAASSTVIATSSPSCSLRTRRTRMRMLVRLSKSRPANTNPMCELRR